MECTNLQMSKNVIVIGGGPAGLMAAGTAAVNGCKVILFEKNNILGRKLLITGKGRCNVTNFCDVDNVIKNINSSNSKFMYSALNSFSCYDTYSFFEQNGVSLKIERGNRVFPQSDKASDVRDALKKIIIKNGVEIIYSTVKSVEVDPLRVVSDFQEYKADAVIIATGGLSYPGTGSTGDGYRFAKSLKHSVTATSPALVALKSSDSCCGGMAGLSLKNISVEVSDGGNILFSDFGEMLFTHTGVSGPVILSASSKLDFAKKSSYNLSIDLKPALTEKELDERVLKDFAKYSNKDFCNALSDLLPKSIIPFVVEKSGINPHTKVNIITKLQRVQLVKTIKSFEIELVGKMGYDEAIITSGGVSLSEIDPRTMQSKIVKGIYFAGEVLDIDCNTGGYNLQVAFSTGYIAGKSV